MLPKVRASLLKNLKPLSTESEVPTSPVKPESVAGLKTDPSEFAREHPPEAHGQRARVIPFPQAGEHPENEQAPAYRNPIIEFFGKLRAGFPVLRAMVVSAYSRAAKGLKSGNRQKKGILIDRDQL